MKNENYSIRLSALFSLTFWVAVVMAVGSVHLSAGYLGSIFIITAITNYRLRFQFDHSRQLAGICAAFAGMAWAATTMAIFLYVTLGWVEAILGFWFGATIGMLVSLVPVCAMALIPDQRSQWAAERIAPPDLSVSSLEPYTDTQGF